MREAFMIWGRWGRWDELEKKAEMILMWRREKRRKVEWEFSRSSRFDVNEAMGVHD